MSIKTSLPILRGYFQARLPLSQTALCVNVSYLPYHLCAFLSLVYPSPACLLVDFPVWFPSDLQPVGHLQHGQKSSKTDAFAENHLAKLMAP